MTLAYPWVLLLFPFAAYLVLRSRRHASLPAASADLWRQFGSGRARFLPLLTFCKLLALGALLLALSRPQAGSARSYESAEGIAIELLVDISSSMDFAIKRPDGKRTTRMEVAKEMVERFILGDGKGLPGRAHDLIGLITFARYPDTRSPLTSGHRALVQIVRQLEIQDRPNEDGTAYGDALSLAAARLHHLDEVESNSEISIQEEIKSRIIILLTDGENNSGHHLPLEAAALAKEWDCRVYIISLGQELASVSAQNNSLSAAEEVLKRISMETGGLFRQADDYDSLLSVYEEIDQLETTRIATRTHEMVAEWYWIPLSASALAFALLLLLESTWLRLVP